MQYADYQSYEIDPWIELGDGMDSLPIQPEFSWDRE
jgi:hypothetical protein